MAAPLQYPLCCQTVTFYHADPAAHTITRTVVQGVHFDTRRRETAAGGSGPAGSAATAFLLVIPEKHAAFGRDYTLEPHDRVLAGTGALFPKGVEQTDRWQNLLGQVTARQKMQLVLRLNLPFVPGDANLSAQTARRLLELQAWVAEQSAAGFAPQLGNADPVQETLTAGAARLEQANDEGSAVYTVTLTAHYTMKWSDTFED